MLVTTIGEGLLGAAQHAPWTHRRTMQMVTALSAVPTRVRDHACELPSVAQLEAGAG